MKAWRTIMEEWEQTAKQLKLNAEFLESLCQDKLTHLYQDKRKARKNYQEEHQKIATQFTNVSPIFSFILFPFSFSLIHFVLSSLVELWNSLVIYLCDKNEFLLSVCVRWVS